MIGHREDWFEMRAGTDMPIFMHVDEALSALRLSLNHSLRHQETIELSCVEENETRRERLRGDNVSVDEYFKLIRQYGLDVPAYRLVNGVEDGIMAAAEIGYPVAWKIASPVILHKTEESAVYTNIKDEEMLRAAFERRKGAQYLIQKMSPPGLEIIIGGRNDSAFGPVILCGVGGLFVEIYRDVATRIVPVNESEAAGMIQELKAAPLLTGFRGGQPFDINGLKRTLVSVSRLLCEHPEIELLDINPFILQEEQKGGFAVDVKLQISAV
jgi:acyl-CoA synthetase (NDP forming)